MSSILWTTLPASIDPSGNGYVSVLVTPKLDGTALGPFANWPLYARGATFQVNLYDTINPNPWQTHAATVLNTTFDSSLWAQIFPSQGMQVNPFVFSDNSQRQLWSYSVDTVHENIKAMYASVQATSPTALPTINWNAPNSPLMQLINQYATANAMRVTVRNALGNQGWVGNWQARNNAELQDLKGNPGFSAPLNAVQKNVWLGKRFYDRPSQNKDQHQNIIGASPEPTAPTFDFNQRIAMLADHPYLMRRLGLIIDLQFKWNGTTDGFVSVTPQWNPNGGQSIPNVAPRTAYEAVGTRFKPRSDSSAGAPADATDVVAGMVPIEDPTRFYVTTGDPDGTIQKTTDFATNMASLVSFLQSEAANSGTTATPPTEGLPARRNNGITVTRKGRANVLASRFTHVSTLNSSFDSNGPLQDLYAADVVRGYRVDARLAGTGAWASLHQRRVTYVVNGALVSPEAATSTDPVDPSAWLGAGTILDEGYMKNASGTSDSDPNGPKDLYVHEKLFGWHGWSLSASRPGQQIMPDSSTAPPNHTASDPTLPITSVVRVAPGTLPSLRYGKSYQLRARAVDLAGNSFPLGDPNISPLHATPAVPYGRVEPVPPPVLVYASGVTEGESLETLVIRSNPADQVNAAGMAQLLKNAYGDPNNPLQFTDQGNAYKVYAATCDRHIAPPKQSQTFAEMHGDFDGAFAHGATPDTWYRLGTREEGTFMDTRIASLTDPSNVGYLANLNNPIVVRPPAVPANQPPPVPSAGSVVANRGDPLASGEYIVCQPSSGFLTVPYLPDSMAGGGVFWDPATNQNVWKWSWAGGPSDNYTIWPDYPCLRMRAFEGPTVQYGEVAEAGGTFLGITLPPATILTLSFASTPRPDRLHHLEYVQDYNPQDDITDGRHWMVTPPRTVTLVHAVQKPLAAPTGENFQMSRSYNDTFVDHIGTFLNHSRSTGQIDMAGLWVEYIDDIATPAPQYPQTTGHAYKVAVPYGEDAVPVYKVQHEFGDTKHRIVQYTPTATTRYKVFFPPGIINDPTQISVAGTAPSTQPGGLFSIPSSARPHAPKVAYVVPTFGWSEPAAGQSVRSGNGLRIYLERPWYSSGQDETVGIIVAPATGAAPPQLQSYLSIWGRDPVWDSKTNGPLTASAFTNVPAATVTCLLLENGYPATVLPLPAPTYHPEKELWYVDVDLAPGQTYFPFVSLALVRYQKNSLEGIEISAVTRADMAQLVPDRTLQVAAAIDGTVGVTVTGVAAENAFGGSEDVPPKKTPAGYVPAPNSHYVTANVQERATGSVGNMGWDDVGTAVTLSGIMPVGGGTAKWTGSLTIPPVTTGNERRIIVEEYEVFVADPTSNIEPIVTPTATRLVYVDTVPVPRLIVVRR